MPPGIRNGGDSVDSGRLTLVHLGNGLPEVIYVFTNVRSLHSCDVARTMFLSIAHFTPSPFIWVHAMSAHTASNILAAHNGIGIFNNLPPLHNRTIPPDEARRPPNVPTQAVRVPL